MRYRYAVRREVQAVFIERFWSVQTVLDNGGALQGGASPDFGLECDGASSYVGYKGGSVELPVITSLLTGFVVDYFGDDIITVSGTCKPGETVTVLNGAVSWGVASNPTPNTFTLTRSTTLSDIGAASLVAVGSLTGASNAVTGTVTDDITLYPGLLSIFDPSQDYNGTTQLWGAQYNTQPTPNDWGFDSPAAWTGAVAGELEVSGSAARFTSPTVARTLYQSAAQITGNRYVDKANVASNNNQLYWYNGSYFACGASSQTGLIEVEHTSNNGRRGVANIGAQPTMVTTVTDVAYSENKSISTVYPRGGSIGGTWAQATAASMPYRAPSAMNINGKRVVRFDGAADYMAHSGAASAWTPMHGAAGAVQCLVLSADSSAAAAGRVCATVGTTLTNGFNTYYDFANKRMVHKVYGAAEILSLSGAVNSMLADNSAHVMTTYHTEGGGGTMKMDRLADVAAACGACTTSDPSQPAWIGQTNSIRFNGRVRAGVWAVGATAVDRAPKLHAWMLQEAGL